MLEGLNAAAAGMAAQQRRVDATANDLANANTNGYKHVRVGFRDLVYNDPGRPAAAGVRTGAGSAAVDAGRAFSQGAVRQTGAPLDVAIQGDGFLQVRLADGRTGLTRDGALSLDGERRLQTTSGQLLQPPVTLPAGVSAERLQIAGDGTLTADGRQVGRIALVSVRSTQGLVPTGDNAFVASPASGPVGPAPGTTVLSQGALEGSNLDTAEAMVGMIEAQRTYQLASRAVQMADQMMEIANGVKR